MRNSGIQSKKMRFYFFLFLIFLLSECSSSNDKRNKNNDIQSNSVKKADTVIQYNYLSNSEIQVLIDKQSNKFLSNFWYGMSEIECLEVLRYLMDLGKVEAFLRKGNNEEPIISSYIKGIKVKNHNVGYASESSRIMYLIQGKESPIIFEINFDFGMKSDSLISLSLSATPRHNSNQIISLENYNYFTDIFSKKYGKIIDRTNQQFALLTKTFGKPDVYKRCRFLKNGISIELEYSSGNNSGNVDIIPHLYISYQLNLDNKFSTYESTRKMYQEFEKKNIMKEEQEREKTTLDAI